jgi:hypothetical protein
LSDYSEVENAKKEYYEKTYRGLIGLPARVLQSKEVTSLMQFPKFMLKDFADLFFDEKEYIEGFSSYYTTSFTDSNIGIVDFINVDEPVEINLINEIELDYTEYDEDPIP